MKRIHNTGMILNWPDIRSPMLVFYTGYPVDIRQKPGTRFEGIQAPAKNILPDVGLKTSEQVSGRMPDINRALMVRYDEVPGITSVYVNFLSSKLFCYIRPEQIFKIQLFEQ